MIDWTFKLNDKPMSAITHGAFSFPAFSGLGAAVNRRAAVCVPDEGPIPFGMYYIFDRQSGGLLGELHDWANSHGEWFALYAIDGQIDDETYCNNVKRGNFRLHPKGRVAGISRGCITLDSIADFQHLQAILKSTKQVVVPGSDLLAYGRVIVA